MKLISWNVNARTGEETVRRQADALEERSPDVVALQEVRVGSGDRWHELLKKMGLPHILDTSELLNGRWNYNLLASRWALSRLDGPQVPFPESVLSARADIPAGGLEVHVAHVPNGSTYGMKKVETFEGIYDRLARICDTHRLLCGDFNSPKTEAPDGVVDTWGNRAKRDRWDAAERSVLLALAAHDLRDVFRSLHGYSDQEFTWDGGGRYWGRRFDHVFASQSLNATKCHYVHAWRESGLSDHSAIVAEFSPTET